MKCLVLCCMLGVSAFALEPTRLTLDMSTAQIGQPVRMRAEVRITGLADKAMLGTIAFTSDGAAIAGCEAIAVDQQQAICDTSFPRVGSFTINAAFSGDAVWGPGSASSTLTVGKLDPWIYLALLPDEPVYASGLIVHALVLGAEGFAPTGTFTFSEGGTVLATRPVGEDGRAPLDVPLTAGMHVIQAIYNGDDNYLPSRPKTIPIKVAKAPPVVAISSTPGQIAQPVTITVSVLPPSQGGTVSFAPMAGCAAVPVQNGRAACKFTFTQLGEVPVAATYSGDANLLPGGASMKLNIGRVVAGVYVTSTPASPVFGETVRVNALALGAPGVAPPTGPVVFVDGQAPAGAALLNGEGRAGIAAPFGPGVHEITATYNGDLNYGTTQATAVVVVGKANTTTTLSAAAGGPLTAKVAAVAPGAGTPTGSVRFYRDRVPIGAAMLAASSATLAGSTQAGNVTAEYQGDANFMPSVSAPAVTAAPRAEVTIASDENPAPSGQAVTFTVAVTPNPGIATPSGSVQLTADGAMLGTTGLSGGRASFTVTLAAGSHAIAAVYSGDATYAAASAKFTQVVSAAAATLRLTASSPATVFGQPVTFTAQLAGGGAGTVQFSDGAAAIGAAALVSGAASVTVATLTAGTHTIAASWPGDGTYGAASGQLTQTVAKAKTATSLSLAAGVATAAVTAVAPGGGLPAGSVSFASALTNAPVAVAPLADGRASAALARLTDPIVAVYAGDGNFLGSVSAAVSALAAANAASYGSETFAPEEIVTLFGPNLGGATTAKVTDSVGVARAAEVLFAAEEQAAIVLPGDIAMGPAVVTAGGSSAVITVARVAPGLFTADSSGKGAAVGQALRVRPDGSQATGSLDGIEVDGDAVYLVLYGTGLRRHTAAPECTIAGTAVEVVFAGAQGAFPGLDQVNLRLPASLRGAGKSVVELTVDGVAANAVTVTFR